MYRQSHSRPYAIPGFYASFISLLVLSLFLYGYNYYDAWLGSKKGALYSFSSRIEHQVETYRYQSAELFRLANTTDTDKRPELVPPHKILNDIYWIDSRVPVVDAILFGQTNDETYAIARRFSDYLTILWGGENQFNSMYYLNGLDNSLLLVTSHSALRPELRYRESQLTLGADEKRAEMLADSTALDERETLSSFTKMPSESTYYYTYRAMFNNPGQLTSVVAFDLPVNNLVPDNLDLSNLSLIPAGSHTLSNRPNAVQISINGLSLKLSYRLREMPYQVVYQLSLLALAEEMLSANIWLLISAFLFTALSVGGLVYIRKRFISPLNTLVRQARNSEAITNEIVAQVPVGLAIYDFAANKRLVGNTIATQLLTLSDLNKTRDMAREHHGRIQTTIDNVVYEVSMNPVRNMNDTYLILFRDVDQEAMTARRLQLSDREYKKSIKARQSVLSNIRSELVVPVKQLGNDLHTLAPYVTDPAGAKLMDKVVTESGYLCEWIENIILLADLETDDWKPTNDEFLLSQMAEDIVKQFSRQINDKGIPLYFYNGINKQLNYIGDGPVISKIFLLLLNYAVSNLRYGKLVIRLKNIFKDEHNNIKFEIIASGSGLPQSDLVNRHDPFMFQVADSEGRPNSGLAFYLCDLLCKKLKGELKIDSKPDIGTHYSVELPLPATEMIGEPSEVLEDTLFKINIINPSIREIINTIIIENGGILFDKNRALLQDEYDILITDFDKKARKPILFLRNDIIEHKMITPSLVECNYNFNDEILNAITLLIEQSLTSDEFDDRFLPGNPGINTAALSVGEVVALYKNQLAQSTYKDLFATTVPPDISKMYTEAELSELQPLALTVHRVKGVFAVLDFDYLKSRCEDIERCIADKNKMKVDEGIREIDAIVTELLQQGNQEYE
ncbi:phosphotransferase RcsD [Morganella morganii]|uniref:phosphotransferase RcsD n=1 Tax=Morganella morganii TaxID=582 RepID=UPI0032DBEB30